MTGKPVYIYVTPYFPSPETWRGAFSLDFVRALAATGRYDVRVFVPDAGLSYDCNGIHVERFPVKRFPSGLFPWLLERWNAKSFLAAVVRAGINPQDIAVCHGHTRSTAIYPIALKRIAPRSLSLLHHHLSSPLRLETGRWRELPVYSDMFYRWTRRVCDAIDGHVFCSRQVWETYDKLLELDGGRFVAHDLRDTTLLGRRHSPLAVPQGILCYNGYDASIFKPDRIAHKGFAIGCVANFFTQKRQSVLLEAVGLLSRRHPEIMSEWRLRFVGSGPLLSSAVRRAEALGLDGIASFEREMDHSLLPQFFNSIDLMALPSVREGFGCVYMESFACGTPFIATAGVSTEEVILPKYRDLWLAKPDDPADLADKLWRFYVERPKMRLSRAMDYATIMDGFLADLDGLRARTRGVP